MNQFASCKTFTCCMCKSFFTKRLRFTNLSGMSSFSRLSVSAVAMGDVVVKLIELSSRSAIPTGKTQFI